ncbi:MULTISPECIES: hypothetical protein [Spirosoma]|uniref:Uncharacterized protein n=1 Tax=Spirosoma liriopis TaxID=2937440 RepID=A0ABT0HG46_9BACT|nr:MULTISPECIES: hypothetical protein [Spirosoma]MCK8490990.1 hypothetical protein [Spirosoma liriopis]UHG90374.1 hypothetical protein LQ777_19240 [Spirosoma oryzicola]
MRHLLLWILFVNPLVMVGSSAQASTPGNKRLASLISNYSGRQASFIDHLLTARVDLGNEHA